MNKIILFFKKLTTPEYLTEKDGIVYWQDKVLLNLLLAASILGLITYIPSFVLSVMEDLWFIAIVDTLLYIFVLFLFFKKNLSYKFRAASIPLISYILGVILITVLGPSGGGPVWLFFFPIITGVLLGYKTAFKALVINALTLTFIGFLIHFNSSDFLISLNIAPWYLGTENPLAKWIVVSLNFMLLNILTTMSVTAILNGLQKSMTALANSQERLNRASKMEAIGLLAGGVAHDLNNILSGVITYPELIAMELDTDDPMRKSLGLIQSSGNRAAQIIQDLLTLARRGVITKDLINLNDLVISFMETPEYKKILSFHPDITVEKHINASKPFLKGSPVHLQKTLMNLISNAAEAQLSGGTITLKTENRHLDNPVKGYDKVEPGTYIVLIVRDQGTGIEPQDLKRIFEPFFTKKVMGRSGTGLGMAVVWGSVQDHEGYIDIISAPDKGTTFELYFPISAEQSMAEDKTFSIDACKGNGEKILIIDDIEDQRKIAGKTLEKLGYNTADVSCGEDAVKYLKENDVDLLILDMIMEPGIDGLETYRRILEFKPDQKAIIASGFSKTIQVTKTLDLGAGQYINKPYTIEKLGIAVKNELVEEKNR